MRLIRIKINQNLLKVVLFLNIVIISLGQSTDASINLQVKEYKEVDLTDYFGVVINSFYVQSEQNVSGVKLTNPVVFLTKTIQSNDFIVKDASSIYYVSQTSYMQLSASINQDKTQNNICQIFLDQVTSIQRTVTIEFQSSLVFADSDRALLNNISVEIIMINANFAYIFIRSIEKTMLYLLDFSNPKQMKSTQKTVQTNLLNIQNLWLFFDADYQLFKNKKFFIATQVKSITLCVYDGSSLSFSSILSNPCGEYNEKMNYLQNDAFYLVKCIQQNGQQFLSSFSLSKQDYNNPKINQAKSSFLEYTLPASIQTRTIVSTINSNLVYVLEQSQNSSVNTMLLHKVTYFQNNQQFSVETTYFDTTVSDTEIIGTFIINNDLIAVVTKDYVLGFSVSKGKLLYRIKLDDTPNLKLINISQQFNTLLFTYLKNTDPVTYEIHEVALSMPYLIIDFSQILQFPLKFSVREQENPFNQVVNFQINILSDKQPTVSVIQNYVNIYQEVISNGGIIMNNNIEKYVIGSDLQLKVKDFSSDKIKIDSKLSQIYKYKNVLIDDNINQSQIIAINSTYLQDVLIIITFNSLTAQSSIFLVKTTPLDNGSIQLQTQSSLVIPLPSKTTLQDIKYQFDSNGVIYFFDIDYLIIPIVLSNGKYYLTSAQSIISAQNFFICDPINNYILTFKANKLQITRYQFDQSQKIILYNTSYNFDCPNCNSMEYNPQSNIVYITDGLTIYSFNYIALYQSQTIRIPEGTKEEKSRNVYLFFTSFVVVRFYTDGTNEVNLYSYNDQISFSNVTTDALYLRSLIGMTYDLSPTSVFTSKSIFDMQEYIAIQANNQNQEKTYVIFRLTDTTSQNQLYCSLPIGSDPSYGLFFGRNLLGQYKVGDKLDLSMLYLSYYFSIQLNYSIPPQNYQSDYLFVDSTSIDISTLNNGQIQDPQQIQLKLSIQKSLQSQNGSINPKSTGVVQLLNYFDSQPLVENYLYNFDDTGAYNGNILGWEVAYSVFSLDLNIYVTSRLVNSYPNGMNAYDAIKIGDLVVLSYQNKIKFPNGFNIVLGDDLDYCYLQYDESSVIQTLDDVTKKYITQMTLFTLCTSQKDSKTQYFNRINVKLTPSNFSTFIIEVIDNKQWVSTSMVFDKLVQTLIKISNDPNLGLIAGIQQAGQIQFSICQVILSEQDKGPFSFDCNNYDTLKYLRVVYFMWSKQSQSNIFFTIDGLAYYQVSKTFDSFQVIKINKILQQQNQNIDKDSQVVGVANLDQQDSTTIVIGFDNGSIFQIILAFDDKKLFDSLISHQYYSENNYIFSGFAGLSSDKSQTVLAMIDISDNNNIFFFYYQSIKEPYTIRSSSSYTFIDPITLNGQMKMFYIENNCYYFMNRRGDEIGSVGQLTYSGSQGIIVRNFNSTSNFDSIGFYLTPLNVYSTQQTTLPVQVRISVVENTNSPNLALILIISIISLLFLI